MRNAKLSLFILFLSATLIGAGLPQDPPTLESEYAQREAAAPGLQEYTGGFHGLVFVAAVFVAIIFTLSFFFHGADYCHEHRAYNHRHHLHVPAPRPDPTP